MCLTLFILSSKDTEGISSSQYFIIKSSAVLNTDAHVPVNEWSFLGCMFRHRLDPGVRIGFTLELGIAAHAWQPAFSPRARHFSHTACFFLLECDFNTHLPRGQKSASHLSNLDRLGHK